MEVKAPIPSSISILYRKSPHSCLFSPWPTLNQAFIPTVKNDPDGSQTPQARSALALPGQQHHWTWLITASCLTHTRHLASKTTLILVSLQPLWTLLLLSLICRFLFISLDI